MMAWLSATIAALGIAGLATAIMIPVMASLTLAASRRWTQLRDWSPLVTLSVFAVAPFLMGLAIGVGAFWPGFLGHVLHLCHCDTEFVSTGHTSVLHPELSVSLLPYSSILLFALLIGPVRVLLSSLFAPGGIHQAIPMERETVRVHDTLIQMSRMGNANAFTSGFFKPTIMVDQPWWQALSDRERHIVVAHERCHQRHHDPLLLLFARIFAGHLSAARRAELLSLLVLQMETRADREAHLITGDALAVADFLLQAHKGAALRSPAMAFFGTSLERRIEALVEASSGHRSLSTALGQWFSVAGGVGLIATTFVFRGIFHQGAEFILSIL
jgi:hypothetical protein